MGQGRGLTSDEVHSIRLCGGRGGGGMGQMLEAECLFLSRILFSQNTIFGLISILELTFLVENTLIRQLWYGDTD